MSGHGTFRKWQAKPPMSAHRGRPDIDLDRAEFRRWHFSDLTGSADDVLLEGQSGLPSYASGIPGLTLFRLRGAKAYYPCAFC
jgi:hypothetical protein